MNFNTIKHILESIFRPVGSQERINFARHLSVGIKSGLPLLASLKLIQRQSGSKRFSSIITELIRDINNGQSLAQSLRRFDHVFGTFFINMIQVGEQSGNLSSTLLGLSQELKKQRDVKRRARAAMIYPVIILIVTLGITVFLTVFIFPKILPIFSSLRVELPFTTKLLISTLSFISSYGIHVLIGLIVFAVGFKLLMTVRGFHKFIDRMTLSVPLISSVTKNLTITNFSRSLGVLLKSGITVVTALDIAKTTVHNLHYQMHIDKVVESVRKGGEIASYLETQPKLFPPMFVGMVEVGESTGNLEENLTYLAEYYESEVDETVKNLTTTLEPLLLVIMGLLVAFIALSIITPIYKITEGLTV